MVDLSRTIADVVIQAARAWADKTAIEDHGVSITFAALEQHARVTSQAFIAAGLQAGDRFAIWAPNIHEWVQVALGGMMAGGILVPLNTRYKGIEAGDILRRSGAKLLFTVTDFLATDYPALLQHEQLDALQQTVLLRGDNSQNPTLATFLQPAKDGDATLVDERIKALNGDCISDIMYTSGTTGQPKGVMSTHGQVVALFTAWSKAVGLTEQDRYLIVNPFFHSFGCKAGWLACLLTGATILPEPIFKADAVLSTMSQEAISMLPGPPTIFQSLLAEPGLAAADLSSLRCAVTGAASVPEQLVRDMRDILGFKQVFTGYGLTECGVVSICREGDDPETIAGTAGRAIENTEVKVVDDQDRPLPAGETGHIKARGYNVMLGYFDDLEATGKAIDQAGWLDTGDIGWQDEQGYIKVTDRAKDMFICGGFNCYPTEIEHLLLRHPKIADVAVVGMPDERMGEVGHAFVVAREAHLPSSEELTRWCREHMANYKVPKVFHQLAELPRNASGKVQKFRLAS